MTVLVIFTCLDRIRIGAIKEVGLTLVQCTMEFMGNFNFGVDELNRMIVSSWFLKLLIMYKDRDLESFASDRACLDL